MQKLELEAVLHVRSDSWGACTSVLLRFPVLVTLAVRLGAPYHSKLQAYSNAERWPAGRYAGVQFAGDRPHQGRARFARPLCGGLRGRIIVQGPLTSPNGMFDLVQKVPEQYGICAEVLSASYLISTPFRSTEAVLS